MIGYISVPLGVVGPLIVNGQSFYMPMATTEGALLASTNRGMPFQLSDPFVGISALSKCGGVTARVVNDGMTRAPILKCKTMDDCLKIKNYLDTEEGYKALCASFESTTSHGKVKVFTSECT